MLVLSTFSGIDLLGRGFRENGFCVVSSGDIILGQDIREFSALSGKFDGVIGGSPCQDFSNARRTLPTGNGLEMMAEFARVVKEAHPKFFLFENVPGVPMIEIEGYQVQRFFLNANEVGSIQNRNRYFQFGTKEGLVIDVQRQPKPERSQPCVMATEGTKKDRRTWEDFCRLQGITWEFDLPDLTQAGAYKAVGNAVNLHVSKAIAKAIKDAFTNPNPQTFQNSRTCVCGCGRTLSGWKKTATDACRKRISLKRESPGLSDRRQFTNCE
ncbi:DNA cytosine methyltransferase [Runella sp.]|uniref:DNA cytosine methyltransferase n=1 Tax=Runella sp. TaxID=1960881 RepID=UPI003D0D7C92